MARANHTPTKDELKLLDQWVLPVMAKKLGTQITREQFNISYQSWVHGGRGWDRYQMGGTGVSHCIAWYQYVRKPGSHEWRPAMIMRAVLGAAGKWEQIELARWCVNCAEWEDETRQHGRCYAKDTVLLENGNRVTPDKAPALRPTWSKACQEFKKPVCELCLMYDTGLPVLYKDKRSADKGHFVCEFHMKSTLKVFPNIGLDFRKFRRITTKKEV